MARRPFSNKPMSLLLPSALEGTYIHATRPNGFSADGTTAHQRAEARPESPERYRCVFEDGPIGIWIVDGGLLTLETNPAMGRMLGYTAEELGRSTFADVTHPDDVEADLAPAPSSGRGGSQVEFVHRLFEQNRLRAIPTGWGRLFPADRLRWSDGAPSFLCLILSMPARNLRD
jgi:PAS domain-containing protein